MQNITLSNSVSMPVLGFGTFQIPPQPINFTLSNQNNPFPLQCWSSLC